MQEESLKELNEVWSNEIQKYEACRVAVLDLIKKVKTLEKEKSTKASFVTKMEVFEKKWTEVTRKVKLVSKVQKDTNQLWNMNQELKESLSKDVEALNKQLSQCTASHQKQPNASQVNSELTNLTTLKKKVEKTKDSLNVNSLAICSTITKVTNTTVQSEEFLKQVRQILTDHRCSKSSTVLYFRAQTTLIIPIYHYFFTE